MDKKSKPNCSPPPLKKIKVESKPAATVTKGHWTQGLKQTLQDKDNIIRETEFVSIIKDKYPKAKYHYLIIAKGNISSVKSLNKSHVSLLHHMIKQAELVEDSIKAKDKKVQFRKGFHAVPSMTLMHMHLISTDFDSTFMKHKKHWNSFTTQFFRPVSVILEQLEADETLNLDSHFYKRMLETELQCHLCDEKPRNMPRLKEHVKTHFTS